MTYEFKELNEIPAQEKPTDDTNIIALENGVPVQIPFSSMMGSSIFVIDATADDYDNTNVEYGNSIKEAMLRGDTIYVYLDETYISVFAFSIVESTDGSLQLNVYPSAVPNTSGLALNSGVKFIPFSITL